MSKKKIFGIIFGFLLVNVAGLTIIYYHVDSNNYCQDLLDRALGSVVSSKYFRESPCLDNLVWLDENHPHREQLEQLAIERYAEKYPELANLP